MSKSRGNIVEPFSTIKEYGADVVRFYLPYVSPVWTPLKFDFEGLKEVYSKFFNPLRNAYNFFVMYANVDNIDISECAVSYEMREEIDKWLLSKYNSLVQDVTGAFEEYDLNKVVHFLTNFVSDDLSNWYIRRNRNRFWANTLDESKKSVYLTTYEVLVGLAKLMAPIAPFLSEEMYRNLTGAESVHLADYPVVNAKLINKEIEAKMDLVRSLISTGRYVREEAKIKVRQPLTEALIDGKNATLIGDLVNLIKEELNVKSIKFTQDLNEYMELTVKPNFKVVGKTLGPKMKAFQTLLNNLTPAEVAKLNNGEDLTVNLEGEDLVVTKEMVEIRFNAKEGFNVGMADNNFIILNTELTEDLILEGLARELVSKIQNMRKVKEFNVADRIDLTLNVTPKVEAAINKHQEYIQNETLALNITYDANLSKDIDINGEMIGIAITKK